MQQSHLAMEREALERLPIFPLPGIVLFPGTRLPLHIFEPRYRQMMADCLGGHRAMAMAMLDEDAPGDRIHPIAGGGVILAHACLPDGRYNLILEGRARLRLHEHASDRPYRLARAEVVQEVLTGRPPDTTGLLSLAVQLAARLRRIEPKFDLQLPPGLDAGVLCDQLADRLIRDGGARQRVLEAFDVCARVDLVTTLLAELLQGLQGASREQS